MRHSITLPVICSQWIDNAGAGARQTAFVRGPSSPGFGRIAPFFDMLVLRCSKSGECSRLSLKYSPSATTANTDSRQEDQRIRRSAE